MNIENVLKGHGVGRAKKISEVPEQQLNPMVKFSVDNQINIPNTKAIISNDNYVIVHDGSLAHVLNKNLIEIRTISIPIPIKPFMLYHRTYQWEIDQNDHIILITSDYQKIEKYDIDGNLIWSITRDSDPKFSVLYTGGGFACLMLIPDEPEYIYFLGKDTGNAKVRAGKIKISDGSCAWMYESSLNTGSKVNFSYDNSNIIFDSLNNTHMVFRRNDGAQVSGSSSYDGHATYQHRTIGYMVDYAHSAATDNFQITDIPNAQQYYASFNYEIRRIEGTVRQNKYGDFFFMSWTYDYIYIICGYTLNSFRNPFGIASSNKIAIGEDSLYTLGDSGQIAKIKTVRKVG